MRVITVAVRAGEAACWAAGGATGPGALAAGATNTDEPAGAAAGAAGGASPADSVTGAPATGAGTAGGTGSSRSGTAETSSSTLSLPGDSMYQAP